jgi:hypothetical protein
MNNKLFSYLVNAGIFKQTPRSAHCLVATEERRRQRRHGVLVWLSKRVYQDADGSVRTEGKGTFRGNVRQKLF